MRGSVTVTLNLRGSKLSLKVKRKTCCGLETEEHDGQVKTVCGRFGWVGDGWMEKLAMMCCASCFVPLVWKFYLNLPIRPARVDGGETAVVVVVSTAFLRLLLSLEMMCGRCDWLLYGHDVRVSELQ